MISHKHKIIFIHIPKCAGSSIEHFFEVAPFKWKKADRLHLTGWDPQHKLHLQHATAATLIDKSLITQSTWDEYFKFAFVRNPWDRAHSDYLWMMKDRKVNGTFEEYINAEGIFKPHLTNWDERDTRADHLLPQHKFIYDENGNMLVDFIGRFESLEKDFASICQKINIPFNGLPHEKKSTAKRQHYSEFFTNDQKLLVEEKYSKDIELFDYEF